MLIGADSQHSLKHWLKFWSRVATVIIKIRVAQTPQLKSCLKWLFFFLWHIKDIHLLSNNRALKQTSSMSREGLPPSRLEMCFWLMHKLKSMLVVLRCVLWLSVCLLARDLLAIAVKASAFNAGEESYGHALNVRLLALYLRPWRNIYSNHFF